MVEKGFKNTKIGLIPEDWEVKKLGEAVEFLDGRRRPIKSNERKSGDYPYYGASGIIDYVDNFIFDEELILLGEDGENILSRNLPLAFKVRGKIWVNNHAHVLRPREHFDITFLTEYLESLDYSLLNSGTAQPKLNKQACLNIKVVVPPLREQKAIAEALSDAYAWIANLEQLIAKKRLIKQGAMQQLLRPKDDWEVKKLGELGFFIPTNSFSRDALNYSDGNVYNIHYGDIHTKFRSHFNICKESVPFIKQNFLKNKQVTVCKEGDLIIADASENETDIGKAIEICFLNDLKVVSGLHTIHFRPHENCFGIGFLGFLFQSFIVHDQILKEAQGTKVLGISTSRIKEIALPIPPLTEQTRIATILSDMDSEIESLENQLAKARQIKQGMMQELLTGKTRLVK